MLVVITGASKGIGFELVKKMADIKDIQIIAISRNISPLVKLLQELKTMSISPVKADITLSDDRLKIFEAIKKTKTPINILINNAGQILNKPFEKITEKELHSVYSTNVFAPFLLIKSLVPLFTKKNKSHIVNISSMGGLQGSSKFSGLSDYSSSKAAIAGLSECLA